MGLDMYLTAERYLWSYPEDGEDVNIGKAVADQFPELKGFGNVKTVTVEVAYWRKANQIHNWFVKNAQNGEDDCERYLVGSDQLQELLDTVNQVLTAGDVETAKSLLPTGSGFFFGSTGYDEWYFRDLQLTKEQLEAILSNKGLVRNWDFYYQASW
jgi:hypothetical protein